MAVPCFYLVIKLSTVKPLGRCVNRIEVTAALWVRLLSITAQSQRGRFWSARYVTQRWLLLTRASEWSVS